MSELTSSDQAAKSACRVDSNVFIGGYLAAADPNYVKDNQISRIVKMFEDDDSYPGGYHRHPDVEYLVVSADDIPDYNIAPGATAAVRFIREGLQRGDRILVHCHMGISRSSTVVLLHLMMNRGLTLSQAYDRLKTVRPIVQPNVGFMNYLIAADRLLRALRVSRVQRALRQSSSGQPSSRHSDSVPIALSPRRSSRTHAPPPTSPRD